MDPPKCDPGTVCPPGSPGQDLQVLRACSTFQQGPGFIFIRIPILIIGLVPCVFRLFRVYQRFLIIRYNYIIITNFHWISRETIYFFEVYNQIYNHNLTNKKKKKLKNQTPKLK